MPGSVIGINMTYGYPGTVSRHGDEVSRTRPTKLGENEVILFGEPVVQNDDGTVSKFAEGKAAAEFCGIAMRKVKSAVSYPNQNFGYYSNQEPCDILQRGGIMVICAWGTPQVGASVYLRTKVVVGTSPENAKVGDLGAVNETDNVIKLEGVKWSSGKDARNVAELTITNRQGV